MHSDLTASLLRAVPIPLVLIGPDERILAMNPGGDALFSPASVGRHHITVLRQPELLKAIEEALREGKSARTRFVDKTLSREASYAVRVAPVQGETGDLGVLVSFEDTTDVENASEIRRNFVANVSHELKTPLTALLGFIETLRGAARDDPDARERFLSIMEREAERMNRLVSDLLSLSRVESAERQRPTDVVAMDEICESTVVALSNLAAASGVELEIEWEGAQDPPLNVLGDADQLQQVLTNLVENAVKYGGSGGRVTLRLARRARELAFRGPAVQVQVVDYGHGFDPVHIPRLTERFYRVDDHRSRAMGGTGLGLAIAKHIVNRHRGRFKIETVPGKGSTFTVLLPALV